MAKLELRLFDVVYNRRMQLYEGARDAGQGLLVLLRESSETGGVSEVLLESLAGMVEQLGAAQEANIRELRREYDAGIDKLKRRVDGAGRPEGAAAD